MAPPISYLPPQAWFFENWQGDISSDYFYHTFAEADHSLAFYTYWDQYHWESAEDGVEVNILMAKNQQWAETKSATILSRTIGDKFSSNARHFCRYLQARISQASISG